MGWRYRSSIRIIPGIRVNLSKSGASLSVGGRGASVNLGKRGVRTTVGLPGSGLSYSETAPWHRRVARRAGEFVTDPPVSRPSAMRWLVMVGVVAGILWFLYSR